MKHVKYFVFDENLHKICETENIERAKELVYEFGGIVKVDGKVILSVGISDVQEEGDKL